MKREKTYRFGIIGLLIVNLLAVSFFLFGQTKPDAPTPENPHPQNFLQQAFEILQLDSAQTTRFKASADSHNADIQQMRKAQRKYVDAFFAPLSDPTLVQDSDSLVDQIINFERQKLQRTYSHFSEVRALLNPDQEGNFQEFLQKALRMLGPSGTRRQGPPPRGHHPPGGPPPGKGGPR